MSRTTLRRGISMGLLAMATALGMGSAAANAHTPIVVDPRDGAAPRPPKKKKDKTVTLAKLRRNSGRMPHQGLRECARRRGDWAGVSMIDAFKRYPYGINHRLPSIHNDHKKRYVDPDLAHAAVMQAEAQRHALGAALVSDATRLAVIEVPKTIHVPDRRDGKR